MTASRVLALIVGAAALLGALTTACANDAGFAAAQAAAVAANPPGLICTLSLPPGQTQFRQGEPIPVILTLSSSKPGAYLKVNWADGMSFTAFHAAPQAAVFDAGAAIPKRMGFAYSGPPPPGPTPITATPTQETLIANDLLRFDTPGTYQVYATTTEVLDAATASSNPFSPGKPLPAATNTVTFQVIPADPTQQHTEVQAALDAIRHSGQDWRADSDAWQTLRLMDTSDAARALLTLMGADWWPRSSDSLADQAQPALQEFPDRAWLIGEMKRDLADPNYSVTDGFLQTLAQLQTWRQTLTWDTSTMLHRDWLDAASAAAAKSASAQPMTLDTLLEEAWTQPTIGSDPAVCVYLHPFVAQLAPEFDRLPPLPQESLIGYEWENFQTPALLPSLRRLWAQAVAPRNYDYELNDMILRRLYALSPTEGRALIVQEMKSLDPRADADALGILPDKTLPALDKPLLAVLLSRQDLFGIDITTRLISRYATAAIFPQVRTFYQSANGWACAPQAALLAYFLRVQSRYGGEAFKRALGYRTNTGCYKSLFTDVAAFRSDTQLETLAVAALDDSDADVAANAAQMLGKYGSPNAEAALWTHLRRLQGSGDNPSEMEYALATALATAQNWYVSPAQLHSLRALCMTINVKQSVDQYLIQATGRFPNMSEGPIYVSVDFETGTLDTWGIGQYRSQGSAAFLAKLAQFPAGTQFRWQPISSSPAVQRVFHEAQAVVKAHGSSISQWQPPAL